jgi:uncharacterized RDD family membrane protein YckC
MNNDLPDPASHPALFAEVLPRRVFAYLIDIAIMGAAIAAFWVFGLVLGLLTFGLAWLAQPLVVPTVVIAYYLLTMASPLRATIGMSIMDVTLVPTRGQSLDGLQPLLHPVLFWLSVWISWPISLLFSLITPRRQMVHDLIAGELMVRRSALGTNGASLGQNTGYRA